MNNKNYITEIGISFALYWIFAAFIYFVPQLKNGALNYYLFLPAGIKFFAVLVFGWRGALGTGLAIFSRLTITDPTQPWFSWIVVAIVSSLAMYLVVELMLKLLGVDRDLSNFRYYQIVLIATVTSIVNGFLFVSVVSALGIGEVSSGIFSNGVAVVMGNFTGNAVFVCVLVLILRSKVAIKNFIARIGS